MIRRASQAGLLAGCLLAAYLLVLQAVLGGLAMGTHAGMGVALGPGGEVICLNAPAEGDPRDAPAHLPDCCTAGCRTGALASLPPPEFAPLPAPLARPAPPLAPPQARAAPVGTGHLPHNARAPPIA